MTISSAVNKVQYTGNGATTAFAFGYLFYDEDDLVVTLTNTTTNVDTVQTITTHYTVTGAGNSSGGTVTFVTAPTASQRVTIQRIVAYTQTADYTEAGAFPAETHEKRLDLLTMQTQQLAESADRSFAISATSTISGGITVDEPTAGAFLQWNNTGTGILNNTDGPLIYIDTDGTTPTTAPTVSGGTDGLAIGNGATVSGTRSIGIGLGTVSGNDSVIIHGSSSTISGASDSVIISSESSGITTAGTNNVIIGGFTHSIDSNFSAVIVGGDSNTIEGGSQSNSVVVGGSTNEVDSSAECAIIGGESSLIQSSSDNAIVIGGESNTVTGATDSAVLAGSSNVMTGDYSAIISGLGNNVSADAAIAMGLYAQATHPYSVVHGNGASLGAAQNMVVPLRRNTTDATLTEMFIDGSSARITIPTNTAWCFEVHIVGGRTDVVGDCSAYVVMGGIKNIGGTTALIGSISTRLSVEDNASTAYSAAADDTNDALVVYVQGIASQNYSWAGTAFLTQIKLA